MSVLVRRRWHDAVALAIWLCLLAPMWAGVSTAAAPQQASFNPLARQVEVIRTAYGVPHIYADNLRALGYALGYLQLEDYGDRVPLGLLRARGELARHVGRAALDSDFESRPYYLRAMDVYPQLAKDTRDVYEGFAGGVNRYIETHPDEFDGWDSPTFTGFDVAALYVYRPLGLARRWIRRLTESTEAPLVARGDGLLSLDGQVDEGSSSWALAPSRTTSGAAILLRNPHLSWQAGYWEAHVVVPGQLDFYGDFRIGAPLGIIGGFNRHLGFSTSNNDVNNGEAYALEVDPARADHYLLDGVSVPLRREYVTRPFRDGDDVGFETRERLFTDLGRVLHRDASRIYVLRSPEEGEFRAGEQFLRLIQARSLEEWKAALRIAAHPESNFTYADAEGNIFYIWNAVLPVRPHPAGEIAPVPVERSEQMWTAVHSLDELPQLLNPAGGYVRNENDAPWLTNLRQPLNPLDFPPYFEAGEAISLRSQHSLSLIDSDRQLSLEDVVRLKHSYRMVLADRVKDDLLAAVRGVPDAIVDDALAEALRVLERWDNTVAPDSRGGVLFAEWWRLYSEALAPDGELFAQPWMDNAPTSTPRGLAQPTLAASVFPGAVQTVVERFGSVDVAWGDVHRVRRGSVDEPAGGCAGRLGCFRVLNFRDEADGRRRAVGGDGWVVAVEFTSPPRAYSVLAYGQSSKDDSPHHADQAAMFARGEMKPVAYTREDVERQVVRRYRPGLE